MYLSLLSPLLLDGLYERFIELPEYILNDDWLAIIVPGFQFENNIGNCEGFQRCVEQYVLLTVIDI